MYKSVEHCCSNEFHANRQFIYLHSLTSSMDMDASYHRKTSVKITVKVWVHITQRYSTTNNYADVICTYIFTLTSVIGENNIYHLWMWIHDLKYLNIYLLLKYNCMNTHIMWLIFIFIIMNISLRLRTFIYLSSKTANVPIYWQHFFVYYWYWC